MEEAKKAKGGVLTKLDGILEKSDEAKDFTREGILDATAKLVVCDDQVRLLSVWP